MGIDSFRGSPRPTLGVELEFQVVDPHTWELAPAAEAILAGVPAELADSVKPEFYSCCVEVNTGVCRDVAEVGRDLAAKHEAVAGVAGVHGVRLAWGGTHPFSHWLDQPITPEPRYAELSELLRETLCRQLTFGLHVHVGVPDGDAAVRACNRLTRHTPALLALSANSPFWCGRATGLHSHRMEVMGASPTGGPPPHLAGWAEFVGLSDRLAAAGFIKTFKELWWDVRPSPAHGTVEVRVCDMPLDLTSVLGLTALIQCLVHDLARPGSAEPEAVDEAAQLMVRQNRWRAARYGPGAILVDPCTGLSQPATDAVLDLVDRLAGVAEQLGCSAELEIARGMARRPSGSDRQLAEFERTGELTEVVRLLAGDADRAPGNGAAAGAVAELIPL